VVDLAAELSKLINILELSLVLLLLALVTSLAVFIIECRRCCRC